MYNSSNELVSLVQWGKAKSSIPLSADRIVIQRLKLWGEHEYMGFLLVRDRQFCSVFTQYDSSPGTEQSIKPFKDLSLDMDTDTQQENKNLTLRMDFHPFNLQTKTWEYEFEISSDKDFKNILYTKKATPDHFNGLDKIYFKFPEQEYEDLIMWNPELYYRARRILLDGYKTEWAGNECGNLLRKRYQNHTGYLKFKEMDKYLEENIMKKEKQRREIKAENQKSNDSLINEKNKIKAEALQKKIDENQAQIEELSTEIEKCNAEYQKMRDEYREKYETWRKKRSEPKNK